jgi:copper oxidase (laccase) domain-containing protein
MIQLIIGISTVADGSMYNRHDDLDEDIIKNRELYLKHLDIDMDDTTRVDTQLLRRAVVEHETSFCRYVEVGKLERGAGMKNSDIVMADALITKDIGHALMLPVADCVGAALYDSAQHILMLDHLGRHSLEQGGAQKSVEYLYRTYGTNPSDILVWLTPAPSKTSYPIWALNNKGMKEATFEQLLTAGIMLDNITDVTIDTDTNSNYFSYSEFLKGNRLTDGDHMIVAMMSESDATNLLT